MIRNIEKLVEKLFWPNKLNIERPRVSAVAARRLLGIVSLVV